MKLRKKQRPKTVWIVNHYALSPDQPGGTRHYTLAKYLKKGDWHGILITASTELNTGKQLLNPGEKYRQETVEGVEFLRIKASSSQRKNLHRLWNMLSFSLNLLFSHWAENVRKPDLVMGSTVHPFAALGAYFLAKRYRVPFFFEIRDLWPQTLLDMKVIGPLHPLTWILEKIESFLIKKAKKVVTLLPHTDLYFKEKGFDCQKLVWIPNGVDLENFPFYPRPEKSTAAGVWTLVYFGAHGKANGLDNVIDAMALIGREDPDSSIKLLLIGNGPEKPRLMEKARNLRLEHVHFLEAVPKEKIPEVCSLADAFLFNLLDIPVFCYGISANKLFDFMAGGRPILFCCEAKNNPVEEAACGLTISPGSPQDLAKAILEMRAFPLAKQQEMGQRARSYIQQHHDFSRLAEKLASLMDDAIDETRIG